MGDSLESRIIILSGIQKKYRQSQDFFIFPLSALLAMQGESRSILIKIEGFYKSSFG